MSDRRTFEFLAFAQTQVNPKKMLKNAAKL